ncbi:MAG TPA: PTS galactitol transporter subunit IIB [Candidatus Bathyarchaeota archaeon]|nr:PTS galactitol transporter subunit IIB [Candidatus Bathyarchaeota archaeon]
MKTAIILIACGTAIATATVVAEKLKEALKKYGIKANTIQCKAAEINYYLSMHKPDVVVHTTPIPKIDVPAFPGHAFLTGIGEEELVEKIAKTILGEEKKD